MVTATSRIETARLALTPLRAEDATDMVDVVGDPALYTFTGGEPPTHDELGERFARWAKGSPRPDEAWHNWIVRLRNGTAIGHLQATVAGGVGDRQADIAWLVGATWQGNGYASEAARALVSWLHASGVRTVTAHIASGHVASGRVAAAAGLQPTDAIEAGEVIWRREN